LIFVLVRPASSSTLFPYTTLFRSRLLFNQRATFPLAERVRDGGAPLGELFSFVSGLYFRGKLTYARAFGRAPEGLSGVQIISAGEGLRGPDERVDLGRLRAWATVDIDARNPTFTEPLVEHAESLASVAISADDSARSNSTSSSSAPWMRWVILWGSRGLMWPPTVSGLLPVPSGWRSPRWCAISVPST